MALPRLSCVISRSMFSHSFPLLTSTSKTAGQRFVKLEFLARKSLTTRRGWPPHVKKEVSISFIDGNKKRITVKADIGDSLYDAIEKNGIDFHGLGTPNISDCYSACAICHLVFKKEDYDKLPSIPTWNELYILDCIPDTKTEMSRLGCCISVRKDMDGLEVKVPHYKLPHRPKSYTSDFFQDHTRYQLRRLRKCLHLDKDREDLD